MKLRKVASPRGEAQSGFSLAEVLVAMFVIVVGLSGVTSSLWWATDRADSGKFLTEATNHGRALFEVIASEGMIVKAAELSADKTWPDGSNGLVDELESDRTPLTAPPFDNANLAFQIQAKGQAAGPLSSGGTGSKDELSSELEKFRRNIDITRKVPGVGAPVEAFVDRLAVVRIRIYWNEKNHERKAEIRGVLEHNV